MPVPVTFANLIQSIQNKCNKSTTPRLNENEIPFYVNILDRINNVFDNVISSIRNEAISEFHVPPLVNKKDINYTMQHFVKISKTVKFIDPNFPTDSKATSVVDRFNSLILKTVETINEVQKEMNLIIGKILQEYHSIIIVANPWCSSQKFGIWNNKPTISVDFFKKFRNNFELMDKLRQNMEKLSEHLRTEVKKIVVLRVNCIELFTTAENIFKKELGKDEHKLLPNIYDMMNSVISASIQQNMLFNHLHNVHHLIKTFRTNCIILADHLVELDFGQN